MSIDTRTSAPAAGAPAKLALTAGFGTLLLWSGTPIANKIVVQYMDGLTAGLVRSTLAGSIAFVVAVGLRLPFPKTIGDRALLALAGIASFAAWPITMSVGIERTTAGHAALILATIPVIAVMIAAMLESRMPRAGWWLGAGIALTGCVLLVGGRDGYAEGGLGRATFAGDAVIFLGGAICAVGYVAGGRLAPRIGAAATTFWGLSVALVVLVPFLIVEQSGTAWSRVETAGWAAMGWMSLLSSLLAYLLWFYALGHGGIGRMSSLLLVMPAITLIGAAVVLGESLNALLLASCVAVVGGTYVAQRFARRSG